MAQINLRQLNSKVRLGSSRFARPSTGDLAGIEQAAAAICVEGDRYRPHLMAMIGR